MTMGTFTHIPMGKNTVEIGGTVGRSASDGSP